MYKKPIIVFEGIEGSGKSVHITNVANYLKKKGRNFIKIREPGGSPNSEKIRKLILSNKSNFNKITDLLLYLAARNENLVNIIQKNTPLKVIVLTLLALEVLIVISMFNGAFFNGTVIPPKNNT